MPNLTYSIPDFLPFTKIISADVNTRFNDIKTLFNTTGLTSTNVQQYGLTRDRLAQTSVNQVLINDSAGTMSSEAQLALSRGGLGVDLSGSLATNPGNAVIVNAGGNALTLGSPSQATIIEAPASSNALITAGETLAANAATCLDLAYDSSGNAIYRVFNADYSLPGRRRSFLGFATSAATVTAGIYTWVASANFVTSNVITYSINGRAYSTSFTSSNSTTLQAVATQMATDPDVSGAVSDGVHTVTVTGKGALFLNITSSTVTGGASQATIVVTNTQTPVGQAVRMQSFGPLAGFTSLTPLAIYYLSTGGAITTTPADTSPVQVGQAWSSTVLFIGANFNIYQFSTPGIFVRSHGTPDTASNGTQDVEHFNFTSWSAGTASAAGARSAMGNGDSGYNGFMHQLDGVNTGASATKLFQRYNKVAWATLTNRATVGTTGGYTSFNGFLYCPSGSGSNVDKWNGASWSAATAASGTNASSGNFTQGGLFHSVTGGSSTTHNTLNSADTAATGTVFPSANWSGCSSNTANAAYSSDGTTTNTYRWSGSWSSAIIMTYKCSNSSNFMGAASGYNLATLMAVVNGGNTVSGTSLTTAATFNDTAWASTTASTNARGGAVGGVI